MKLGKRLQDIDFIRNAIATIASWVMRFAYWTTKWTFINKDIPDGHIAQGTPFLVAMWHDRLMTAPCAWRYAPPLNVLASSHRDGRLIAQIASKFNMRPIYGSTGRCTLDVTKKLINACKQSEYTAIIPDGPRGPRHEVSEGIITIAKLAKCDILVFASAVKRYKKCRSWDQFIIAYPFNRGCIAFDMLTYDEIKDLDTSAAAKLLKEKLDQASLKAAETITSAREL